MIAPAKTGSERSNNKAVIPTAHTNSGIRSGSMFWGFIFIVVEMKLTAPKIEDTPAKCREKMAKSTDAPAWAIFLAKGG